MLAQNPVPRYVMHAERYEDHAMMVDAKRVVVDLPHNELLAVQAAAGMTVRCLQGALWITQHRAFDDVLLNAGESCVLANPGAAVIQALHPTRFALEAATAKHSRLEALSDWLRKLAIGPAARASSCA
jgi:Protein of unknown function (DUF2917)